MTRIADEAINGYLLRMPDARQAALNDPLYSAQIKWLKRAVAHADMAMEDEGVPAETRRRVVRTIVYGSPDEDEALARMDDTAAQVRIMQEAAPVFTADPAKLFGTPTWDRVDTFPDRRP